MSHRAWWACTEAGSRSSAASAMAKLMVPSIAALAGEDAGADQHHRRQHAALAFGRSKHLRADSRRRRRRTRREGAEDGADHHRVLVVDVVVDDLVHRVGRAGGSPPMAKLMITRITNATPVKGASHSLLLSISVPPLSLSPSRRP